MESCSLSLTMPRFSLRYRTEQLGAAFSSLGATEAFQPSADFSRMLQNGGIYVHTAIHEAVLEVDENGTRAAAFTGFGLRKNACSLTTGTDTVVLSFVPLWINPPALCFSWEQWNNLKDCLNENMEAIEDE